MSDDPTARFAAAKRASGLQVLFRVARRLDALALARVRARTGLDGLRPAHTSLLPHLDLDGTRLTVLADRVGISKQAVGQLVDDLVGMGVLARVPDPTDRRAKRIVFTSLDALHGGLGELVRLEADLAERVGDAEMAALADTVRAIDDVLDQGSMPLMSGSDGAIAPAGRDG